jgi:8-oxo-dGTP pyrophosphatase MutT (NUDIX family)
VARPVEEARSGGAAGGELTGVVRAAGGVVVRGAGAALEVLLVHRPAYDDWTFPKGKAEGDETDEDCALREVEEETGLRCRLLRELPSTDYTDAKGRPKRVRYWAMEVAGGELRFEHEVDGGRWVAPEEAEALLSYERDVEVLRASLGRP